MSSKRKGAELSLTLISGLKGSFEWGPNKSSNITFMSFELQEWFSSQNWSDFCQEFISELQFATAYSHQLRAALVRSRQLGALQSKILRMHNSIGNNRQRKLHMYPFPKLSLPVFAGQVGENLFHAYIKVPYPLSARYSFSPLLILPAWDSPTHSPSLRSDWTTALLTEDSGATSLR